MFLVCCILSPLNVFAGKGLWEASVIFSDDLSVTMAWDVTTSTCPSGIYCGYELELRNLEIPTFVDNYKIAGFNIAQRVVNYKRSGHYKLFMRSMVCDDVGFSIGCVYSGWVDSMTNGMIVIGVPSPTASPWILYWRLPAPSGGTIQ